MQTRNANLWPKLYLSKRIKTKKSKKKRRNLKLKKKRKKSRNLADLNKMTTGYLTLKALAATMIQLIWIICLMILTNVLIGLALTQACWIAVIRT